MAEAKTITVDTRVPPTTQLTGGKSVKPIAVDIFNCTLGRRVIWDGLFPRGAHVTVESGETKYNATLAEWVVKELRATHRAEPKKEVRVYDAGKAPKPDAETSANEDDDDGE